MQLVIARRSIALAMVAMGLVGGIFLTALIVSPGRSAGFRSAITSQEALLAHGVDLSQVPLSGAVARVDADQARAIGIEITKMAAGPKETHHVMARPTADAAPQSSWLLLFEGGDHGGSLGGSGGKRGCHQLLRKGSVSSREVKRVA